MMRGSDFKMRALRPVFGRPPRIRRHVLPTAKSLRGGTLRLFAPAAPIAGEGGTGSWHARRSPAPRSARLREREPAPCRTERDGRLRAPVPDADRQPEASRIERAHVERARAR